MAPAASARRTPRPLTYAQAGVDIAAGDELVDYLKAVNPAIGGFSGLFSLPSGLRRPRLVASTDGVGTKLLIAQLAGRHETVGIDLVAMVVNDLVVCGARPLFFLDYFATGRLKQHEARAVLKGVIDGCAQANCPLLGGETAEMPGMYAPGHYDLAGFAVGVVEADRVIDGRAVRSGDVLLGLGSSGLHSNGFSLVRRVLLPGGEPAQTRRALRRRPWRGGPTLADALLEPTRIYVKPMLDLVGRFPIKAAAHITGGGIAGNLVRVLPPGVRAWIDLDAWRPQPIFDLIAREGPVEETEMFRAFNMGIGMILVVAPDVAGRVAARAERLGETCRPIGWIDSAPRRKAPPIVELVRRSQQ